MQTSFHVLSRSTHNGNKLCLQPSSTDYTLTTPILDATTFASNKCDYNLIMTSETVNRPYRWYLTNKMTKFICWGRTHPLSGNKAVTQISNITFRAKFLNYAKCTLHQNVKKIHTLLLYQAHCLTPGRFAKLSVHYWPSSSLDKDVILHHHESKPQEITYWHN